jgi:hypothetical protein
MDATWGITRRIKAGDEFRGLPRMRRVQGSGFGGISSKLMLSCRANVPSDYQMPGADFLLLVATSPPKISTGRTGSLCKQAWWINSRSLPLPLVPRRRINRIRSQKRRFSAGTVISKGKAVFGPAVVKDDAAMNEPLTLDPE